MSTPFGIAILICHGCELRQRPCAGPCVCSVNGRDIRDNATAGVCPRAFFETRRPGPGSYSTADFAGPGLELSRLLEEMRISLPSECRCSLRAAEMNERGQAWCEANMATIVGWLKEAAAKVGLLERLVAAMGAGWVVREALARSRARQAGCLHGDNPVQARRCRSCGAELGAGSGGASTVL